VAVAEESAVAGLGDGTTHPYSCKVLLLSLTVQNKQQCFFGISAVMILIQGFWYRQFCHYNPP